VNDDFPIVELDCVDVTDAGPVNWAGVWLSAETLDASVSVTQLIAGGAPYSLPSLPSRWALVEIVVDWGRPLTHIKVAFDQATVLDTYSSVTCDAKTDAFLFLGLAAEVPGEALYDNVVLDVVP
jgi:hypothetical protein